jgi:hypothetical protein
MVDRTFLLGIQDRLTSLHAQIDAELEGKIKEIMKSKAKTDKKKGLDGFEVTLIEKQETLEAIKTDID